MNKNAAFWLRGIGLLVLVAIALVVAVEVRTTAGIAVSAASGQPQSGPRTVYVTATPTRPPDYAAVIEVSYGERILWTNLKDQSARVLWVDQPPAGNPPVVTFAPFGENGGTALIMSPSGDPMIWTTAPNLAETVWFGVVKVILAPDHVRVESTDGAFSVAPPIPTPGRPPGV